MQLINFLEALDAQTGIITSANVVPSGTCNKRNDKNRVVHKGIVAMVNSDGLPEQTSVEPSMSGCTLLFP